jgi:RHS repeat-associated protein
MRFLKGTGSVATTSGSGASSYGFTNEYQNSYIKLIYLRSRMYSPLTGRYLTRDSWQGDYNRPLSLNRWNYTEGNPINLIDPTGHAAVNIDYLQDTKVTYFTLDPIIIGDSDAEAYTQLTMPNVPTTPLDYLLLFGQCFLFCENQAWCKALVRPIANIGPDAKSVVNYYNFAEGISNYDLRGVAVSHVSISAYSPVTDVIVTTKISDKYGIYNSITRSPSLPPLLYSNIEGATHKYNYEPDIRLYETPEDRISITIQVDFSWHQGVLNYYGQTIHELNP